MSPPTGLLGMILPENFARCNKITKEGAAIVKKN
jgi:hypothetical protein